MRNGTLEEAHELLKLALDDREAAFRPGQGEAICALVHDNARVLIVQRTGWGKSMVYSWQETDDELARELWSHLSPKARELFALLVENPGKRFSADELAPALEIPNGRYGVAGTLAWPGTLRALIDVSPSVGKPTPTARRFIGWSFSSQASSPLW